MVPQAVANALWAYATLGVTPEPPLLSALSQAAQREAPRMVPQNVANALWACAVLEQPAPAGVVDAAARLPSESLSHLGWCQLHQAHLSAPLPLPEATLREAERAWRQQAELVTESRLQQDVTRVLHKAPSRGALSDSRRG